MGCSAVTFVLMLGEERKCDPLLFLLSRLPADELNLKEFVLSAQGHCIDLTPGQRETQQLSCQSLQETHL